MLNGGSFGHAVYCQTEVSWFPSSSDVGTTTMFGEKSKRLVDFGEKFVVKLRLASARPRRNFFGCGYTKKSAKMAAAKVALKYLRKSEQDKQ